MLIATSLLIGGFFLGSFSLQQARGYGALHVGLLFLPVALATGIGAHLAGRLLVQSNAKVVATLGLGLAAGGYTAAAAWSTPVVLVAGTATAALGIGATIVTAFTAALSDVSPHETWPPLRPGEHISRVGRISRNRGPVHRGQRSSGCSARQTRGFHRRLHHCGRCCRDRLPGKYAPRPSDTQVS